MRRQIGFFSAFVVGAAIFGAPTQARAAVIQSVAWTVEAPAPAWSFAKAPADPGTTMLSVPVSNDGAAGSGVFLDTDSVGGVTLLPITTVATAPATGDDDHGEGWQARQTVAADADACEVAICTISVDQVPFALGTAAFAVGSFISDAVAAVDYAFRPVGQASGDTASAGYGPFGMVGMGNIALLAVGLIGLALTRRRDHIPPG